MTSPEQSLSSPTILKQFLGLAELVCRQEVTTLESTIHGTNLYSWIPSHPEIFGEPIGLEGIEWTSHPQWNNNFSVVSATFHIYGDDAMEMKADRNFHRTREDDSFDPTLNNDPWAQMVLEHFRDAYESHDHTHCEPQTVDRHLPDPTKKRPQVKEADEDKSDYKVTNKRLWL